LGRCEDFARLRSQKFVGYKKEEKKRKKKEGGKIIESIAIGLRHLSVRRPKKGEKDSNALL